MVAIRYLLCPQVGSSPINGSVPVTRNFVLSTRLAAKVPKRGFDSFGKYKGTLPRLHAISYS